MTDYLAILHLIQDIKEIFDRYKKKSAEMDCEIRLLMRYFNDCFAENRDQLEQKSRKRKHNTDLPTDLDKYNEYEKMIKDYLQSLLTNDNQSTNITDSQTSTTFYTNLDKMLLESKELANNFQTMCKE